MKYEKEYFNWQKEIGVFGGIVNRWKFENYITKDNVVVDFGSGGGYLLKNILCKEKIGIEINNVARVEAEKNGIKSVESISDLADSYADVIISNHALEHVPDPLGTIKQLYKKLKNNGTVVFVVPHENSRSSFNPKDVNQHLYTWNRQTLGNLFNEAGFIDIKVFNIRSKWPPYYLNIYNIIGAKFFNLLCFIYAFFVNNYQVKIVAKKKENN